ncbi:MAG: VOC family protein [Marinicellaceae bacterium]
MPSNPVGWFEIYVDDMDRAESFYASILKVNFEKLGDPTDSNVTMLAFPSNMEAYGASGALVKMEGMKAGGNSTLIYFACDDCSIEESRIVKSGGQILQEKMAIGEYGFIALAQDTEGNMFGLHSQK